MNKAIMKAKGNFNLCSLSSKKSLFVSLLLIVALFFSCFTSVFNEFSSFAAGTTHKIVVSTEAELKNAVDNAQLGKSVVIALDNDVTITSFLTLMIHAGKNITLTSNSETEFYKLIGVPNRGTITVSEGGMLVLDGIIVTHHSGDKGSGVIVGLNGQLVLCSGEISGNYASFDRSDSSSVSVGGGVNNRGSFVMSGGVISNNTAIDGGGVSNRGSFVMSGGVISNNTAIDGGGVNNWRFFNMTGGTITHNVAEYGGGVYIHPYYGCIFDWCGGMISGNTARYGDNDVNDVYHYGDGELSGDESSKGDGDPLSGFSVSLEPYSDCFNETVSENSPDLFSGLGVWGVVVVCVGVGVVVVVSVGGLLFYRSKKNSVLL